MKTNTLVAFVASLILSLLVGCGTIVVPPHLDGTQADAGSDDAGADVGSGDVGSDAPGLDAVDADDVPTPPDSVSQEIDAATDAQECVAELAFTCADGPDCLDSDLEKFWIGVLNTGHEYLNQDSAGCSSSPGACIEQLHGVYTSAYLPPDGSWSMVMNEGVKKTKFANKRIFQFDEAYVVIIDITSKTIDLEGAPQDFGGGVVAKVKYHGEIKASGPPSISVTGWLCDTEGNSTASSGLSQSYNVF